ncbi:MAG: hypothetical protein SNH63_07980, partial [Rikenellaceae bacterium]
EWIGSFEPKGSGCEGAPIVVKSYGTHDAAPRLDGGGMEGKATIYLYNLSHWEINDIEIVNDAEQEGDRRGIYVVADTGAGVLSHIYLKNLHIHHIKGTVGQSRSAKRTAGIAFSSMDISQGECRFDDIWIDGCIIHDCDNQGIITEYYMGSEPYPSSDDWQLLRITRARVTNNLIYNISKNAMILRLFDGGVVENNLCHTTAIGHDGEGMTGNTIFTAACRGTVFQFNEGYKNMSPDADGSLYDADLRSPQTIWQYSYSHDNAHGLFWLCTVQDDAGVVCRNNISRNDKGIIFCVNYPVTSVDIYQNTVLIDSDSSPILISERSRGGKGTRSYSFKENIIYGEVNDDSYIYKTDGSYSRDIANNEFLAENPLGKNSIANRYTTDPEVGAYRYSPSEPKATMAQLYSDHFSLSDTPIRGRDKLVIAVDQTAFGSEINVRVFNADGKMVYDKSHPSKSEYAIKGACKEPGVYWVVLESEDTLSCERVWVI